MDIQFWIWVIIVVLTLVARARRQKPKPEPRQDDPADSGRRESDSQRPMTFEELLKEIQAAKEERAQPKPEPVRPFLQTPPPSRPVYKEVDYDDDLKEEEQDLETVFEDQRSNEVYEQAKRQAFNRQSLEETMKLEDTIVRFSQFKGYESTEEKGPMDDFLREIKDPEGFKKAFIMSEILQRKF
jgi:hypothetical protein